MGYDIMVGIAKVSTKKMGLKIQNRGVHMCMCIDTHP